MKFLYLALFFFVVSCIYTNHTAELICNGKNCFTVRQNKPFTDDGSSGIYFNYGDRQPENERNNFVHVRYTDAPFYYRWNNDTLVLRCPYWKVVENTIESNKLFDFKVHFTEQEKLKYGYDVDIKQFYTNISKDFKKVNTYSLK